MREGFLNQHSFRKPLVHELAFAVNGTVHQFQNKACRFSAALELPVLSTLKIPLSYP